MRTSIMILSFDAHITTAVRAAASPHREWASSSIDPQPQLSPSSGASSPGGFDLALPREAALEEGALDLARAPVDHLLRQGRDDCRPPNKATHGKAGTGGRVGKAHS